MLGFNKWFVIFLIIALVISFGMKDWKVFFSIMIPFIIFRIIWRFFTN